MEAPYPAARVVLASASPRRRAILAALGVVFDQIDAAVDERPMDGEAPHLLARRLAAAKALAVARSTPGRVVLGADTVVVLEDTALSKPSSESEAVSMLRALRGREHTVITAVSAAYWAKADDSQPVCWTRHAITRVWMRAYSDPEIGQYIASGDPFDKAGSYAIQHAEFHPVDRLDGCYLNVVGLPPRTTLEVLLLASAELGPVRANQLLGACPACPEVSALAG